MILVCIVVSLGSLRCTWDAASTSVAAKVQMALSNLVVDWVLSPPCSVACTIAALRMCICRCQCIVVRFSNSCVQSLASSSHMGPCVLIVSLCILGVGICFGLSSVVFGL